MGTNHLYYILLVDFVVSYIVVSVIRERDWCFNCYQLRYMQRDLPMSKVSLGENKVLIAMSSALVLKCATCITDTGWNRVYALTTLQESEASSDVIICMLKLFSRAVY